MKRFVMFIVACLTFVVMSAETEMKFDPEAYKAEQHKFILSRVNFTQEEAAKFFALHDEMRAKERQLFAKNRNGKRNRPVTNDDCAKAIIDRDNTEIELKKLQAAYHRRMLKVVPATKLINALFAAEDFDRLKFNEMFRNNLGGRHRNHPPRPGKPKNGRQ